MLGKNKNAKSTIVVCLIGAVVLMGILTGIIIERFNTNYNSYKIGEVRKNV